MLVAARSPVAVGVVEWPGSCAATVVLKRTFDLHPRGVATPSRDPDMLGLDRFDDAGHLLYPSDFAPTKSMCDVGIVGEALLDPTGPIRIVVDPLRKLVERASMLGPRAHAEHLGDPTDVNVVGDWTVATFDFERFQWAPRDQRLPAPPMPLDVVLDVGSRRYVTRVDVPDPQALLIDESGWSAPQPIALRIDAVGFDLARERVQIVWRGVVDVPRGAQPVLVIDLAAPLRSWSPREMMQWPRAEAADPALLRRLAALTAGIPRGSGRGTVRLAEGADEEEGTTTEEDFGAMTTTLTPSTPRRAAAVLPADAEQGPLRASDLDAPTLQPQELAAARVPAAPTFGPPPPRLTPPPFAAVMPPPPAEPVDPTRISQVLSQPALQAAIAAQAASTEASERRETMEIQVIADGDTCIELLPEEETEEQDEVTAGTVQVEVPQELRDAPPLPFRGAAPTAPLARQQTLSDGDPLVGTMIAPTSPAHRSALPFAPPSAPPSAAPTQPPPRRPGTLPPLEAHEQPTLPPPPMATGEEAVRPPPPPPPPRMPAHTAPAEEEVEPSSARPLAAAARPASALPFAASVTPRTAPPARDDADDDEDAPPMGTGTVDLDVRSIVASWEAQGATPAAAPRLAPRGDDLSLRRSDTIDLDVGALEEDTVPLPPISPVLLGIAASLGRAPASPARSHVDADRSPPADVVEGITAARFAAIKGMLWARGGARHATLAQHGISDLEWRVAEKRFAGGLKKRTPDELRAFVAAMRDAAPKEGSQG